MTKDSIILPIVTMGMLAATGMLSLRTCVLQNEAQTLIQERRELLIYQRELLAYGDGLQWATCIHIHGLTREECDKQHPAPGEQPTP